MSDIEILEISSRVPDLPDRDTQKSGDDKDMLTVKEYSRLHGIKAKTVYDWVERGLLKHERDKYVMIHRNAEPEYYSRRQTSGFVAKVVERRCDTKERVSSHCECSVLRAKVAELENKIKILKGMLKAVID